MSSDYFENHTRSYNMFRLKMKMYSSDSVTTYPHAEDGSDFELSFIALFSHWRLVDLDFVTRLINMFVQLCI